MWRAIWDALSSATAANWAVAAATLLLAAVAVFQEPIRSWLRRPRFRVTAKTEPPDCVWVPFTNQAGAHVADAVYLRIWVENDGNDTARSVEVYAGELQRRRADGTWERVQAFPPMNLRWANLGGAIYSPSIAPGMGKHCDIAHIAEPASRAALGEVNPSLNLPAQTTSMAFDLMVSPNHRGHIVGPGLYRLAIVVAAENSRPVRRTVEINLKGGWYPAEAEMLRDGVGIRVLDS